MKKILLSTTFLIAGTLSILAQGSLVDFTTDPTLAWPATPPAGHNGDRYIYSDVIGGQRADINGYTAKLFENGVANAAIGNFLSYGPLYPEYFGYITDSGVKVQLTGGLTTPTSLEVVVYDLAGAEAGRSLPFNFQNGASSPPSFTDTLMVNFKAFALVPEPSTIALGVLGLGALLLFRHRK